MVIWWIGERGRVSTRVADLIRDPDNEILVSAATAWELAIKVRAGKLQLPPELLADLEGAMGALAWQSLPIPPSHALATVHLPDAHKDPFDRLIAAQARIEGLVVASVDPALSRLGVRLVW